MNHYTVVAAVIIKDNKYLCMQRKSGKYEYTSFKFEFPGGKVETGETFENALLREIEEELDLVIDIDTFYMTVNYDYPDFKLTMHAYLCKSKDATPKLNAHQSFTWRTKDELGDLDWAAADVPIVNKLTGTKYE